MTSLKVVANMFQFHWLLLLLPAQKGGQIYGALAGRSLRKLEEKEERRRESGESRGHSERCSSSRYPASLEEVGCVLGALTQLWVFASASVLFIANSPEQLQTGNTGAHGNTYSLSVLDARAWLSAQGRAQILGQSTTSERTNSATHPAVLL